MADFGLSAVAGSSKGLLRLPFYFSVFIFGATGLTLLAAVGYALAGRSPWSLLLVAGAEFAVGWLFLFLGLIGDQVRLIAERTRNVPLVIEKERVNF